MDGKINTDWKELRLRSLDSSELDKDEQMVLGFVLGDLSAATNLGLVPVMRYLVEELNVSVNIPNPSDDLTQFRSCLPIEQALVHPDPRVLDYLLLQKELDFNLLSTRCNADWGITVLQWAVASNIVESDRLQIILQRGTNVDVDKRNFRGFTALHLESIMSSKSTPEKVRHLLDAGANPNVRDSSGYTPLDFSRRMLQYISKKQFDGAINVALTEQLYEVHKEVVKLLQANEASSREWTDSFVWVKFRVKNTCHVHQHNAVFRDAPVQNS